MELGTSCWPRGGPRGAHSMGGNGLIVSFEEVMPKRLGRLQRQSQRAFRASAGPEVSTSEPAGWCWAGQPLMENRMTRAGPVIRPSPLHWAASALASKGRLMRCTVDGLTPNRSATTRMPGRPGVARASRIRFSNTGAIGGRPRRFPSLRPSQARRGRVPGSWRARTRQIRPSSETLPCPQASWCRVPVGAGIDRS